jgi:hypothetical protein
MATRSTIALEFADGTVQQVYCHFDGYLSNNGRILQNNWTDPFKLRDLIDLGDMSSLGTTIGEKHDFDEHIDACTFYGRDRGEEHTSANKFTNFEVYLNYAQVEEYNYILRTDGVWYVQFGTNDEFVPLTEALTKDIE